jgi:hypothetical protein
MKLAIKSFLAALTLTAFTSCATSPVQITSLETKYGTLVTNVDGSQSFTTKPSADKPVVVGTVVTTQGSVTTNPDGSVTFTSAPPKVIEKVVAESKEVVVIATK